jgi:hypothetical protein
MLIALPYGLYSTPHVKLYGCGNTEGILMVHKTGCVPEKEFSVHLK